MNDGHIGRTVCMNAYLHEPICVFVCMQTCMYIYIHRCVRVPYVCVCVCIYVHMFCVQMCTCVSLQESDRVEVQVVQVVGVRRSSVWTLVLHQEALQLLLTRVSLLHHQQLKQKRDVRRQTRQTASESGKTHTCSCHSDHLLKHT